MTGAAVPGTRSPLVTPGELRELLAGPDAPVVLDVRYRLGQPGWGAAQYAAGHVPGACFVDLDRDLADPVAPGVVGGRHPLPAPDRFAAAMRRCGVRSSSLVVCLDQQTSLAAARAWWLLRHHGHQRVAVLDGGMAAWLAAGGPVTSQVPHPAPGDLQAGAPRLPVVDAEQAGRLAEQGHTLVDVRAAERFRGEDEPIDPVAGHVPGAVNLPATRLQHDDGRFLAPEQLRVRLSGVRAGDAMSCGSGITASQALLACEVAGITGVALYPGSWSDWCSDPARPVATGDH